VDGNGWKSNSAQTGPESMLSATVAGQLERVIGRSAASDSVAGFRNEFKTVVDRAKVESAGEAEIAALLQLRTVVERWTFESPTAQVALDDWVGLYGRRQHLPESVIQATFAIFPAEGAPEIDWPPLLLSTFDRWVAGEVIRRGFVKADALRSLPETSGRALYESPLLDEILESGISFYPSLLKEYLHDDRPQGLLQPHAVVVRAYVSDGRRHAPDEFVRILAQIPERMDAVLHELLCHPTHAMRLTGYLVMRLGGRPPKPRTPEGIVLHGLATACREHGHRPSTSMAIALSILGVLRCSGSITGEEDAPLSDGLRSGALASLRAEEAGNRPRGQTKAWLPLSSTELYEVFQEFLRHLPTTSASGEETPERRLRAERYAAQVEVLSSVIEALDSTTDGDSLREELEIALFNLNVRSIGNLGEVVPYDPEIHSTVEHGAIQGDAVRIVSPGWILGDGDHRRVIRKAEVQPGDRRP
jgi:hypothetical protein